MKTEEETKTRRMFIAWWRCPECKETYVAPADQTANNVVGCERCNLEWRWKNVKEKW